MATKKKQQAPQQPNVVQIETFRDPRGFSLMQLTQKEPSAFNGYVSVIKYKVTVEVIDEPKEVYQERLQKLWEECDNHHQYGPIKGTAAKLGVELTGDFGAKRKR